MKTSKPDTSKDDLTVYISNLSYQIDRFDLKRIFSKFGEVRQVKLVMDVQTQKSKGMAFVRMSKKSECKAAIEGLNGQIIDGRTVKAAPAIPMKNPAPVFSKKKQEETEEVPGKEKKVPRRKKQGLDKLKEYLAKKDLKKT